VPDLNHQIMKRTILISALLTLLLGTFYVACQYNLSEKVIIAKPAFDSVLVKRGEYLFLTNVCDACHSPKKLQDHSDRKVSAGSTIAVLMDWKLTVNKLIPIKVAVASRNHRGSSFT